ncbi:MAG: 50S ribosomal protein L23 [Acidobacteria bacterium]|jgi:large subunit ribosomal protein L23|nr:50S ribosomal protein L23 [Acidobacteriota bacterium]
MRNPQTVLIRPLLTEKNLLAKERRNTLAFEVAVFANKIDVARAVEKTFQTKVASVRIVNTLGKIKRMGRSEGKRPDKKKAYVTLKKGQKPVEYFEGI